MVIKKDAMEHHVSRQHPEKHISKLRQDWQQKKIGKSGKAGAWGSLWKLSSSGHPGIAWPWKLSGM